MSKQGVIAAGGGLMAVAVLTLIMLGRGEDDAVTASAPSATAPTQQEHSTAAVTAGPTDSPEPPEGQASATTASNDVVAEAEDGVTSTAEPLAPLAAPATVPPQDLSTGAPADALVDAAVQVQGAALGDPESSVPDQLEVVARGPALDAIEAQVLEYQVQEWSQVGTAQVVSTQIVALDEDAEPPITQVLVCLDHSGVDVVDAEGVSMVDDSAPMRVLQLWTLERVDGRWVLVEQRFPEETTC